MKMSKNVRKISWTCNGYDAVWTGAYKGEGLIIYNPETKTVTFKKLRGCDPYWYQPLTAIMRMVPPEDYQKENREWPFKVSKIVGMSGAIHLYLTLYSHVTQNIYSRFKTVKWDISANGKSGNFEFYYGDLVEFFRLMWDDTMKKENKTIRFSRNPNDFLQGNWRFERFGNWDIVTEEELYIPPKKEEEDE